MFRFWLEEPLNSLTRWVQFSCGNAAFKSFDTCVSTVRLVERYQDMSDLLQAEIIFRNHHSFLQQNKIGNLQSNSTTSFCVLCQSENLTRKPATCQITPSCSFWAEWKRIKLLENDKKVSRWKLAQTTLANILFQDRSVHTVSGWKLPLSRD